MLDTPQPDDAAGIVKPGGAAAGWVDSFIAVTVAYLLNVLLPGLTMPREISRRFDTVLCRMSAVVNAMEAVVGAERI
ncbi:hypothetical protein [Mycobacterium gastri]|uniref:Uncharacterized protein n=1 Tax=Mycobacterium gastri TaxID=1777 RepID=A0A1X1VZ17_MYCGS|nr:hypothetical protein [Mycobacterium gastri]ETW25206.1 hypothetical protein MGAST_04010 [Mycobacterium gastri 'Wayne']ORV75563.1 hypothetical protein AWC07_23035 [Mycobacterium gastri]